MKNKQIQLEEMLRGLERPVLGIREKRDMKANLMGRLMMNELKNESYLRADRRAVIKEKVMALIDDNFQRQYFWRNFFAFHKKLLSSALLLMMVFSMFAFVNVDTRVVFASTLTELADFSGDVKVVRLGEEIPAEQGMELFENDTVVTGGDARATVQFFDDSVSRLRGDTEIVVDRLYKPRVDSVKSEVEVSVIAGTVWSKVVNLVEAASFSVTANELTVKTKRAGFNVAVALDTVKVDVFRHSVDISDQGKVAKVVSGQKIVKEKTVVKRHRIAKVEKNDEWVQENLESDKQYIDDLGKKTIAARKELESGEPSLRESAAMFLTFDDVKKRKMKLDILEKDFIAAQVSMSEGEATEDERVDLFVTAVKDFYTMIEEVTEKDSEYADELSDYIDEKVLSHKKVLLVVKPDSGLFELKDTVDELELLSADGEEEIMVEKVGQALENVASLEESIDEAELELVTDILDEYTEEIDEKIDDVVLQNELKEEVEAGLEILREVGREVVRVEILENPVVPVVAVEPEVEKEIEYGVRVNEEGRPVDPLLE